MAHKRKSHRNKRSRRVGGNEAGPLPNTAVVPSHNANASAMAGMQMNPYGPSEMQSYKSPQQSLPGLVSRPIESHPPIPEATVKDTLTETPTQPQEKKSVFSYFTTMKNKLFNWARGVPNQPPANQTGGRRHRISRKSRRTRKHKKH